MKAIQTETIKKLVDEYLDKLGLDNEINNLADIEKDSEEEVIKKIIIIIMQLNQYQKSICLYLFVCSQQAIPLIHYHSCK